MPRVAYTPDLFALGFLLRRGVTVDTTTSAVLAFMWFWTGAAYHWLSFAAINHAAFVFQGVALLYARRAGRLAFRRVGAFVVRSASRLSFMPPSCVGPNRPCKILDSARDASMPCCNPTAGRVKCHLMDSRTLFGLFSVTAMMICYALESRSHWFVLAFAGTCVLASTYGFLQGAWPFGIVEGVWSLVALLRWRRGRRASNIGLD